MTDAFAIDRLAKTSRAELRNHDLAGAESRCREHERKVQDVKYRRRVEIHTALFVGHPVVEVVYIRQDIGVSQHNALGMAGCAASVDESQDRFRIVNGFRIGIAPNVQGFFVEHQLP